MTYNHFNETIFNYYLAKSSSSFFTLSIDKHEIKSIIDLTVIRTFNCLRYDWKSLLESQSSIPQYFGLLAVQCLAASSMENDTQGSAEAYQIRLRELLNLNEENDLQRLFKGIDWANPIQEHIWYQAKEYLKKEHNLDLQIPLRTFYKGRYVQYPRSQALLNSEDLKRFTPFFSQEFEVKEDIPLKYFKVSLEACFYNLRLTNRTIKLWGDCNKRDQCISQIFNYYNLWEGELYLIESATKDGKTLTKAAQKSQNSYEKSSLILNFEDDQPKFYLIKNNELNKEVFTIVRPEDVEKYKLVNNEFLIFNKSDYYENEFNNSRFLFADSCCYVVTNKINTKQNLFKYFERNNSKAIPLTNVLTLYKFQFIEEWPNALNLYMQDRKPVKLFGGLKINRRSQYFHGYGPSILSEYETIILCKNRKVQYDPIMAKPGLYTVRVDYCKDASFEIVEDAGTSHHVLQNDYGWNLSNLSIDTDFDLQGIILKEIAENENVFRKWVSINAKMRKISNDNSSNILIKALNNSFSNDSKS